MKQRSEGFFTFIVLLAVLSLLFRSINNFPPQEPDPDFSEGGGSGTENDGGDTGDGPSSGGEGIGNSGGTGPSDSVTDDSVDNDEKHDHSNVEIGTTVDVDASLNWTRNAEDFEGITWEQLVDYDENSGLVTFDMEYMYEDLEDKEIDIPDDFLGLRLVWEIDDLGRTCLTLYSSGIDIVEVNASFYTYICDYPAFDLLYEYLNTDLNEWVDCTDKVLSDYKTTNGSISYEMPGAFVGAFRIVIPELFTEQFYILVREFSVICTE